MTLPAQQQLPAHIQYGRQLNADINYNLSHSCAQIMSLSQLFKGEESYLQQIVEQPLEYAALQGGELLRQAIADFHQVHNFHDESLSAENVVTFAGAQEGLAALYHAILVPADEVVVFTPSYPSLVNMVEQCGATIRPVPLFYDGQWHVDFKMLRASINNKTKLIVINSPHNPTGALLNQTQINEILSLARAHNCYLISDDVTQPLIHSSTTSTLGHNLLNYEKTIVVSVLSKSFGLAGIRLGWVVSKNCQLLEKLLAIKAYGSICTSQFDEWVAEFALRRSKNIIENNLTTIRRNKAAMSTFVDQYSNVFSWEPPKAGVLSLLKIDIPRPLDAWLVDLAQHQNVLLLPAWLFGLNEPYVRLGLGQEDFTDGLTALSQFCDKNL